MRVTSDMNLEQAHNNAYLKFSNRFIILNYNVKEQMNSIIWK